MADRREGYGDYLISTYSPIEFKEFKRIFAEYFVEVKATVRKTASNNRIIYILKATNEPDYILKEIRQKIKDLKKPWILRVGM